MIFEFSAHYLTAADYMAMFKGILDRMTESPNYVTATKRQIESHINWAKQHLKKQDRITWYLRWVRLELLRSVRGYSAEVYRRNDNATNMWNKVTEEELRRMETRTGESILLQNISTVGLQQNLDHYLSLPIPEIQNTVFDRQSIDQLLDGFDELETIWKESQDEDERMLSPQEGDEIAVQFPDGWAWWKLGRAYCPAEAEAMGHCGNVNGKYHTEERILSLRKPVNTHGGQKWLPYLTFILDKHGFLGEMKGRANEKPAQRYHGYIMGLLERGDIVKGIKGGGYLPEHNFTLRDLTDAQREYVVEKNPALMTPLDYYKKHGLDETFHRLLIAKLGVKEQPFNDKGLKVGGFEDIQELVKLQGNEHARWLLKYVGEGGDYIDVESYDGTLNMEEVLDTLDRDRLEYLWQYIQKENDDTLPESLRAKTESNEPESDEEDDDDEWRDFEPTNTGDLVRLIQEQDIVSRGDTGHRDAISDVLIQIWYTGQEVGLSNEMFEAFDSAARNIETEDGMWLQWQGEGLWDVPIHVMITYDLAVKALEEADKRGVDGEIWDWYSEYYEYNNFKVDAEEPRNGYSGWDKDAVLERFDEEFDYSPPTPEEVARRDADEARKRAVRDAYREEFDAIRQQPEYQNKLKALSPAEKIALNADYKRFYDGRDFGPFVSWVRQNYDPQAFTKQENQVANPANQ